MNDHEDLNEYQALVKRNYGDYSLGHREMYDIPIRMLQSERYSILESERCSILDVGFGIGYGVQRMIRAGIVRKYLGYEPCKESYDYVKSQYLCNERFQYVNESWPQNIIEVFDYSFCIEVIEHVPLPLQKQFLEVLKVNTRKLLFLSTPDSGRSLHGVRTVPMWKSLIKDSGFRDVVVYSGQWTDLYICQP